MADVQQLKHEAGLRAVEYVRDGMCVGLGTGSTAEHAVREIGRRVAEGLSIKGVPTSNKTAALAKELCIPLLALEDVDHLDVTIDGADEVVLQTLDVIKGAGGALLHEKIVAQATREVVLIVDETKVVSQLGDHMPLPVEIVQFGWNRTYNSLLALGCKPQRRSGPNGEPYITDSGNYLIDCMFAGISDPSSLARQIKQITGVVEHGLFVGIAQRVIVAHPGGVLVYNREA